MKSNNFMKRITGALFAFSLLIGIGVAASVTANAQYPDQYRRAQDRDNRDQQRRNRDYENDRNGRGRNNDNYGNYGGSYQLRQTALNAGYNEGSKSGRDDRNHNKRYDYNDSGAYQKATKDYSSKLGDKQSYQRYFREAFATGYRDGYRGRA